MEAIEDKTEEALVAPFVENFDSFLEQTMHARSQSMKDFGHWEVVLTDYITCNNEEHANVCADLIYESDAIQSLKVKLKMYNQSVYVSHNNGKLYILIEQD